MEVFISDETIRNLKVGRVFKEQCEIHSLDFDRTGNFLITVELNTFTIYDCLQGCVHKIVENKKHGSTTARFTNMSSHIIHNSTNCEDDGFNLICLSLSDQKIIRCFKGHKRKINSLEISPTNDIFLSASPDETIRLWDIKSPNCVGCLCLKGTSILAVDPQGLVFAVATNSKDIRMYDTRNYEKGPFSIWNPNTHNSKWNTLEFSNNGKNMLLGTKSFSHYMLDSFTGSIENTFSGHNNTLGLNVCPTLSPDSNYVISGSQSNDIYFWNKDSDIIHTLEGHKTKITHVKFNPKYLMLASVDSSQDNGLQNTSSSTVFWI